MNKTKKKLRIASFDIGKKNFAQYIEEMYIEKLNEIKEKYKSLPKKLQRRVKGDMNEKIEEILKELFLSGKRIQAGVYDLRDDKTSQTLDLKTRRNIVNHLMKFSKIWNSCDIIIIEQQFFRAWNVRGKRTAGSQANVDAIKIGEAVLTWFISNYPTKIIEYFGSQNKTQILGAPWRLNKAKRKKWAEVKTLEICELREDQDMINLFKLQDSIYKKRLNNEEKIQHFLNLFEFKCEHSKYLAEKIVRERQKLDDVSDTVVQLQAYKYKKFIAEF
jgi:hypothetical protein